MKLSELFNQSPVEDGLVLAINALNSLSQQAKVSHWNVKGPRFGPLHTMFGDLYDYAIDLLDTFAERIKAKDIDYPAQLVDVNKPSVTQDEDANLFALVSSIEAVIATFQGNFDPVTKNLMDETQLELEKWQWKLKAHLNNQRPNPVELP